MEQPSFNPEKITRPFPLLASWFTALIVVDGGFLGAASLISNPLWAPGALVIAAIVNVPIFLIFLLQTKYRPEMQDDKHYRSYIQDQRKVSELSEKLKDQLNGAGLDITSVASGKSLSEVPLAIQVKVKELVGELSGGIQKLSEHQRALAYGVSLDSLLEIAKAYMADHKWEEAAKYLDEFTEINPNNWEAQRSRGIAHAMSRRGASSDSSALKAYNLAIQNVPREVDINTRAILYTYRGAMYKRLGRLQEAKADFKLALEKAREPMVVKDIDYNLSCLYAITGDTESMLSHMRKLKGEKRKVDLIRRHIDDYFKSYADHKELNEILGSV